MRLHLLGALRLDTAGAAARRPVLSQPRRVALLAYLALRAPRGAERRDALLAVFWPESDTNHARGALRNALHYLRVALGADVIRSHGSEEVQLDLGAIWCDAVEFERLLDAGDAEAALRLYGGDLLDGFFISEAPAFEQWVESERARLRQRAIAALRSLASDADTAAGAGVAALRLRQLLELAPTDEPATRALMHLLAAGGDRGAAFRVFHELQARLAEYGLEVDAQTRALAASLRPDPGAAARSSAPSHATQQDDGPALSEPSSPATEATHAPARAADEHASASGSRIGGFGIFALIAAMAAFAVGLIRVSAGAATASPDVVAVLPFEYRGPTEHAYLAEGLADLLAANLHGAGELQAVDPRALLPRMQALPQPIVPSAARRAAAAHGAGLFVLGSVTEAGGRLRIAATLYGLPARIPSAPPSAVAEGSADELLLLVDRVSLGLLAGRETTMLVGSALRTTGSVEALKEFLHGEAALRRFAVHEAVTHYRRATAIDSSFALAHYRLSSAAYREGLAGIPAPAAAAALRHAGRLVREDSLLVAAWYHHVAGSVLEAHRLYEEALVLRPGHVEASFQLGELLFHWGALIGIPAAEASAPFSRALAAEPKNVEAALHLARLAARDGSARELDSLVVVMQDADPGGVWHVEMDALRAFQGYDAGRQDDAIAVAAEQPGRDRAILEAMAAYSYNLEAVERLTLARLDAQRAPLQQARMELFLAQVRLGRGRFREAERGIEAASALPAARRIEYRAMLATLPFGPLADAELAAVRAAVATHPDLPLRAEGGPFADRGVEYPHLLWPGLYRPRRLYLLGALHARLGELPAAHAVADSLASEDANEPLTFHYERLTRARTAAAGGDAAAALRHLGPVRPPPLRTFESLVDHGRPFERWQRAEALREAGRTAEALRWYATFPDPIARDLAYLAPSHLRRAEIHDAAGELAHAARHYRRFTTLWADADPELQPIVERARTRLRQLETR